MIRRLMTSALAAALVFVVGCGRDVQRPAQTSPLLVGAYYYLFYPENLSQGTLRAHLIPPQAPPANQVDTRNPDTAARDIKNARSAGINFFAFDWWPNNPGHSKLNYTSADDAMNEFLAAPNIGQIKFCMFYETWNLGFNAAREATPVGPQMERRFDSDLLFFANHYFANPSYLRVNGRPVVLLYLTRTLTGDVAGMIDGARRVLAAHGYDPYFIGDEIYWRVTPEVRTPTSPILTTAPQVARIEQFDAITAYTLYYGDKNPALGPSRDFVGYAGTTSVVADELKLLNRYRDATGGRVPVVPDVSPGFNDRGVRLSTNHPAEPREWLPGSGASSTLDHLFTGVAAPAADPKLRMVMITAWDEWNEDTGIEPIGGTPTSVDNSASGHAYAQGYTYGGEGSSELTTLHRDIEAADGGHGP